MKRVCNKEIKCILFYKIILYLLYMYSLFIHTYLIISYLLYIIVVHHYVSYNFIKIYNSETTKKYKIRIKKTKKIKI